MFGMAEELDEPRPASCDKPGGQISSVKVDNFAYKLRVTLRPHWLHWRPRTR
jgi:hypothetical protein